MLKKILLAIVPVVLSSSSLIADDDLFDALVESKGVTITDAQIAIADEPLALDIDSLDAEAGSEVEEDAIEACFRRFGYRHHRGWGYGYGSSYRSLYYNHCYRPFVAYRPIYHTYCAPIVRYYWGCY